MKLLAEAVYRKMQYEYTGTILQSVCVYISAENFDDFTANLIALIYKGNNVRIGNHKEIESFFKRDPAYPRLFILKGNPHNYCVHEHWIPTAMFTDAVISSKKCQKLQTKTFLATVAGAIVFGFLLNYIQGSL